MGVCISAANAWRPDWAWATEAGKRYEWFVRNFAFAVPGTGAPALDLPIRMDDDADFLLQALWFPQIAVVPRSLSNGPYMSGVNARATALARLRTSDGKQLSSDMILSLGAWGAAGFVGVNGFGVSLVDPLFVPRSGVVSLDVQCTTNATWAVLAQAFGTSNLLFEANVFGTSGNGLTIQLINPGAPNVVLSAATIVGGVQVTLGTDGASVITSTVADVTNVINDTAGVNDVMMSQFFGPGTDLVTALGPSALVGAVAASNIDLYGALIGWKVFDVC